MHRQGASALTDYFGYRMLYGGIDSDGVTERARDLTSVMAGVAQSHTIKSSCPIVMKEIYLLPEADRRLFGGVDTSLTPTFESGRTFQIQGADWRSKESLSLRGRLAVGEREVSISFLNDFWDETDGRQERPTRPVGTDQLRGRDD